MTQFDIRLPERKPLPHIILPPKPEPKAPPARRQAPVLPQSPRRHYRHSLQKVESRKAKQCKMCGQPRYEDCTHALCEIHFREWHNAYHRGYYRDHLKGAEGR